MDESMDSITLKNNIPILSYKSIDLLSKSERHLSNFFKCCPKESMESNNKCYWSGNNVNKFKEHIQKCHQSLLCSYCIWDKKEVVFTAEEADQLIEHLMESHGRRVYQCNRCQYRATTCTHIQLHQISIHYPIWSKNNSSINYDSLDDGKSDICKIITCKSMVGGPNTRPAALISKFSPDLDSDLAQNLFYCLFCDYSDEEVVKIFMHCVVKHRDFDVCAYHKECPKAYSFESTDSEPEVIPESENSDFDEPIQPVNGSKSLVNNFESQLSFHSEQSIPGLSDDFIPLQRPPSRQAKRHFPPRGYPRRPNRRPDRFNRGQKRKDFYDSHFDDDFEDSSPSFNSYPDSNPLIMQSMATPVAQPPISIPLSGQMVVTPIFQQPMASPHIPQIQQNSRQQTLQKKKKKMWQRFNKIKSNEKLSPITYGQYKQQQEALKTLTSTPSSSTGPPPIETQIPPEIDLNSNDSGLAKNSFKKINRIGVTGNKSTKSQAITYVRRTEDEVTDEYSELLNEKIPKRGIRARFESQNHFELLPIQSTINKQNKNFFKCVICPNEPQLLPHNISLHLSDVHKTDSSLKCGYCEFIGSKESIRSHSKVSHPGVDEKMEKFIVHITQNSSIGLTRGSNLEKSKTTARKSTGGSSKVAKGQKGALIRNIKDSTFMGPLQGDVTQRKQTGSHQPFERVHNRSAHSSNIRPKKRPKLIIPSDSETEMQTQNYMPSDVEPESDVEMHSDVESGVEQNDSDSDDYVEELPKKAKVVSVAKKSTSKPSSQNISQVSITLTEEQIPTKYFCVFCTDSFIITDKSEAIEHYKTHLNLGYTCNECHQFFGSYSSMEFHWIRVHKSETMDFVENMPDFIRQWIVDFLDNQIKFADFAEELAPNSTGIHIKCPLCEKAATICTMKARAFDALWKVKLHICKHLNWFPMKCSLCEDSNILFPQNPYLLMKHLIDCHYTSCENLYNISFRGQKPFNDMKKEQMKLIDKNFASVNVFSGEIINSFFYQLMTELDLNYENQLKNKYLLSKEIQVNVERLILVKDEPIDDVHQTDPKPEVKDEDKKDIKLDIKLEFKPEFKTEIKSEFKTETKTEVKDESKNVFNIDIEEENNEDINASGNEFLSRIYGHEVEPIPSYSGHKPTTTPKVIEDITLSSDDES